MLGCIWVPFSSYILVVGDLDLSNTDLIFQMNSMSRDSENYEITDSTVHIMSRFEHGHDTAKFKTFFSTDSSVNIWWPIQHKFLSTRGVCTRKVVPFIYFICAQVNAHLKNFNTTISVFFMTWYTCMKHVLIFIEVTNFVYIYSTAVF
jgi:hypothetical protein